MNASAFKVKVTVEVPAEELWSAVFGSGFESDAVTNVWLRGVNFVHGTWDVPGLAELQYIDEDEKIHKQFYSAHDLAGALSKAIKNGYNHSPCGGKIDMDFSNYDSCVADLLLQVMVYGELVYG